ncbi:NACHT domain-containing protein [Streptomyces sp. TRM 70361]|uniref:NACHT domain-containing protein n=1 Tax=Streptomyces sp. TRM 70361 TaxID=3116553 RepID=UPI002E7C4143|nr:NACHT domain-containing protein [Streptomyces sp. TRM 70361]MEE1942604.1 NACHT domain-containing protein [Streptomyces sp. TRM 70361]
MDAATVGARLAAGAVAPLVRKLLVREGPGAGLADRPVRLSGRLSFRGEKRTLGEKELEKLADELVARAVEPLPAAERLPAHEERATAHALARTLYALGDLDMDDVQAVELGERELARRLRAAAGEPTRDLAGGAAVLHDALLEAACRQLLHFFTQRSTFIPRTLVEQTRRLAALEASLSPAAGRARALAARSAEDAAFERRYADYVARKHSRLTIYGLDLAHSREWRLDTAFLSLEASRDDGAGEQPVPVRTDRILTGRTRVLLRGAAGSGKTTLVQWLAVTAVRSPDAEDVPHPELTGRVPFVLPLRAFAATGGLPTPDRFLEAVRCPLAGAQPPGWADRVLADGRGLLLVDGVDEIPEREREETRRRLDDLLGAFPDNLWLVTSRPSAVRDEWLASQGFGELSLTPMDRDDVAAFVTRWHTAAGADPEMARSLLTALRTKQDLGRLATNPLMCGLLCALHRERRGFLPQSRRDLYEAALSMLLERRDVERGMHRDGDLRLAKEPQITLLQKLAYWMVRNDRAQMDRADALAVLGDALPMMAYLEAGPEEVLRYLLERSGLLREPVAGRVDFVHRTFQDYLAAKALVEARDFPWLVDNADRTELEDVVRMAVAHARPDERARIITGVLGDVLGEGTAVRRVLLALACLEQATELDPTVREQVRSLAGELLPPRDPRTARALADFGGPLVLELLPGPEGLPDEVAEAVVVTATRIGTDAALPLLTRYRSHPSLGVRRQLAWSWHRFDRETYAEEILAHLDEEDLYFSARSTDDLRALRALGGRSRIQYRCFSLKPARLIDNIDAGTLTHLWIRADTYSPDFSWLEVFPRLRVLVTRLRSVEKLPPGIELRSEP